MSSEPRKRDYENMTFAEILQVQKEWDKILEDVDRRITLLELQHKYHPNSSFVKNNVQSHFAEMLIEQENDAKKNECN